MRRIAVVFLIGSACSKAREPAPQLTAQAPADTAFVVTLSPTKLRASSQWPKLEQALATKLPLTDLQKICPSDPVRSIESIVLAVPPDLDPARAIVLVRGVARDVADSCAKSFAASQQKMITVSDEAGLAAYRESDEALYAAWLDSRTVAVAPGEMTSKDRLQDLGKTSQRDPVLVDALAQIRGDHVLAFAFHAPAQSELAGFLAQSGMEPESGYGWLDLDTTLHAQIVVRFATPERAASAAKQPFAGLLTNVKTTVRDRDVTFTIDLDAAQTSQTIDQLVALAK